MSDWTPEKRLNAIIELAWQLGGSLSGDHPHVGAIADHAQAVMKGIQCAEDELARLKRGEFTAEEIHTICHNFPMTVGARAFADGCAAEQRRLYGCAPDVDQVSELLSLLRESYNHLLSPHKGKTVCVNFDPAGSDYEFTEYDWSRRIRELLGIEHEPTGI